MSHYQSSQLLQVEKKYTNERDYPQGVQLEKLQLQKSHQKSSRKICISMQTLVKLALKNNEDGKAETAYFYHFLMEWFPHFRKSPSRTWQSSVRHALDVYSRPNRKGTFLKKTVSEDGKHNENHKKSFEYSIRSDSMDQVENDLQQVLGNDRDEIEQLMAEPEWIDELFSGELRF